MNNVKKWSFSIVFSIVLLEIFLRLFGINQTYTESIGQGYQSYFGRESSNQYNTHHPNDTFMLDHGDFKYRYVVNEVGVREKPLSGFCDSPFYKVIALGDSYTEGVGTSYDSTWPRFMERYLRSKDTQAVVFDGGMSGGDPFFEYSLYRDKLASCHANLVLVAVNTTDIDDFFFRGGMERFTADGRVVNKKGPRWEFWYQHFYVARMVSRFILRQRQQLFVTDKEYAETEQQFVEKTEALFKTFREGIGPNGKLVVVVHPQPTECAYNNSSTNIRSYKVMQQLIGSLQRDSIAVINLYPSIGAAIHEDNMMQYTFENDKHFNGKGYKLFADSLVAEINRSYPNMWK